MASHNALSRFGTIALGLATAAVLLGGCRTVSRSERTRLSEIPSGTGRPFHQKPVASRFLKVGGSTFGKKENLRTLGLTTLGSAGMGVVLDEPAQEYFDDHRPLRGLEPMGDFAGYAVPIGLIVGTRIAGEVAGDEQMMIASKAALDAGLATFLYGEALVTAIGRGRPRAGEGAAHFRPFAQPGNRSFPALHPAIMNSQLKALSMGYPEQPLLKPQVRLPLVGLVAYLRMEKGSHWASDLLPGIILGEIIGKEVGQLHWTEGEKDRWTLQAWAGGIRLVRRF